MSYLVDTHIFLWSIASPKKIPLRVRKILEDPNLSKYVSILSFWEISLKFSLDKLDLMGILPDELPEIAKRSDFEVVNLDIKTVASYYKLPQTRNKDPFDRMLAWQAINSDCTLLTQDPDFSDYEDHGLKIVWQ